MRHYTVKSTNTVSNVYIKCYSEAERIYSTSQGSFDVHFKHRCEICISYVCDGHNASIKLWVRGVIHMTSVTIESLSLDNIKDKSTDRLQKDFIKLTKVNTTNVVEMGKLLLQIKKNLGHGNYANWLDAECNFSQSLANKYVKVVNEYLDLNSELIPNLGIAKALILIAIPKADREEYIESNDIYNKSVSQVKELIIQYKSNNKNMDSKVPTIDFIDKKVSTFNNSIKNILESHIMILNDNQNILTDKHKELLDRYNSIHKLINEIIDVGVM